MPSNMPTQPFPNGEFNQMPNANFPNNPYPQQLPPQKKSNSGCMIAGAIISCLVIVLLCIGCFVAMFVFVQPLLENVSKPMMKTLALLNEICDVEFTEESKKRFTEFFTIIGVEGKDIRLKLTPREFYDTAFSYQLKSEYTYEEFIRDIQPITATPSVCEDYRNSLVRNNLPIDGNNTDSQIVLGPFDDYVIRTQINPLNGTIIYFNVGKIDQTSDEPNN